MEIELENTFTIDEPIEKVWAFLRDPEKVATCLPGAQILEVVSETEYKGAIKLKLGPFNAQFKGELVIEQMDAQAHQIRMVGKGKDARGTGSAAMVITGTLKAMPDGGTEMISRSKMTINGRIAQFGSRMIQDVSKSMFNQFTANFSSRIKGDAQEGTAPQEAGDNALSVTKLAGAVVKGVLGRVLGKSGG